MVNWCSTDDVESMMDSGSIIAKSVLTANNDSPDIDGTGTANSKPAVAENSPMEEAQIETETQTRAKTEVTPPARTASAGAWKCKTGTSKSSRRRRSCE